MRRITYAVDLGTGLVWSRVDGGPDGLVVGVPVYDYANFGNDGDFTGPIPVILERCTGASALQALILSPALRWTRKLPVAVKNMWREFHGFPPLAV